jgi:hypothetical protein
MAVSSAAAADVHVHGVPMQTIRSPGWGDVPTPRPTSAGMCVSYCVFATVVELWHAKLKKPLGASRAHCCPQAIAWCCCYVVGLEQATRYHRHRELKVAANRNKTWVTNTQCEAHASISAACTTHRHIQHRRGSHGTGGVLQTGCLTAKVTRRTPLHCCPRQRS